MNKEKLGAFIKARREGLGMTQKALAEVLGLSMSYVYDVEAGRRRNLSRDKFFSWASVLQVDPKEFYAAAEVPFPLEEKPEKFIALPFDFPHEAQRQVESFAKFLRYQEEFEQFLRVYENRTGSGTGSGEDGQEQVPQPTWEEFMAEVRGSTHAGRNGHDLERASGDKGSGGSGTGGAAVGPKYYG